MPRIVIFKGLIFFLVAVFAVYLGFLQYEVAGALRWINRYEYWSHFLLVSLSVFAGVRFVQSFASKWASKVSLNKAIWPSLFIALVSLILLNSQPKEFKIVMDEPVLIATALHMHDLKQSKTCAKGFVLNGNFEILASYTDKRPTLYPFLLAQLHSLTGYRAVQGIVFNALLTPVFISLLFYVGASIWKKWGGFLAVCLFASVPLLAMNMCGSGFELLNLVLLLAVGIVARSYAENPSESSLNFLVMLAVLLAHTRYESALFIGAVGFVILYVWRRERKIVITWGLFFAPLLLISIPLRRIIHQDNDLIWQVDAKGVSQPFSIEYMHQNLIHAVQYFFAHDLLQPNSILLSVLFAISLICILGLILRRQLVVRVESARAVVGTLLGAAVLLNFGLLMCYFWGQIDDVMAARIALPFILFQVLFVTWVCSRLSWLHGRGGSITAAVGLFFAFVSLPLMAQSNFLMRSIEQHQFNWTFDYVESRAAPNSLIISKQHMAALIQRHSGLIPDTAIGSKLKIDLHLRLRTFSEILIIEYLPYDFTDLHKDRVRAAELAEHFETEVVLREKLNDDGEMRVSRIIGVKMDPSLEESIVNDSQKRFDGRQALGAFYNSLP